ncbi:GNAT family N-acetyltransferase [Cohnella sp. 56]|uniref:GNAT family N-acetyltransferase n=1 Tax=Cohnella sp. 56 TaxID=3113722 RepID=UPI0030E9F8A6
MMSLKNMVRGLEKDAVAQQFIQLWDHDAHTLKFWRASSNFVYTFERRGSRQFLRFVHETDNSLVRIQAELDYMRFLAASDYPTAAPVLSIHDNRVETVETAGDGRYYGVVFEQAAGSPIPMEQMTDQHAEAWGGSLAALHQRSEQYSPGPAARGSWHDALLFISSVLQRHPDESGARLELDRLREQLSALPTDAAHFGLIHYDFQADNLFYLSGESRYCAIDFDDAMYHWYAMDIVSALADLAELHDDDARRVQAHFLTGYRAIRPLSERCQQAFPLFRRFAELYTLARLLRSVEGIADDLYPSWAIGLRDKLLGICERIRKNYRPCISFRPIDQHNWFACTELEVADEQKKVFPVSTVYWLAESAYCGFTPLAIYASGQPAGLAVYAVDPDDGSCWIMAYMIDRRCQRRGIGRAAMEALVRHIRDTYACDSIVLGHRPNNKIAADLYASLDFIETGRTEQEVVRTLNLAK